MGNDGNKKIKEWTRLAKRLHWTVEMTDGGHRRFVSPAGSVVIVSHTPGEGRGIANARSLLRRAGLPI